MMTAGFIWASSQRSPALDQIDNQHHDRNDEQDVNESTHRVGADQSKEPEHQQDHEYCPQHNVPFGWSHVPSWDGVPLRLSKSKFLHRSLFAVRSRNGHHYSFSTTARRFQSASSSLRCADS